ncbi:MAG: dimethylsulfonioproprionate lyase family protein [Pseudomonadota bacterium]
MTDPLLHLYDEARAFVRRTPGLATFRRLPETPPMRRKTPSPVPVLSQLNRHHPTASASGASADLARAIIDAADRIDWLLTYTEEQVGADFLARYGWFELLGPTGHFHADDLVAFIAHWGTGLRYPWHRHAAEEVYAVIDGACIFEAEGKPARHAKAGEISHHIPWQAHALRTDDTPVLTLVIQAGEGLNDVPEMLPDFDARVVS